LRYWLEGAERRGRYYEPVLRAAPTGDVNVTWGEMVEARYLRAYRTQVPLQRLRPFIDALRREFGAPYPLAHFRPYIDSTRRLVLRLQEEADVPDELWLVFEGKDGQVRLNPAITQDFLARVEFEDEDSNGVAVRIYPQGKSSAVVIDPLVSSAAATVSGVRTAILAERAEAFGDTPEELAEEFGLTVPQVKAAIAFEYAA
jgi:uncharacterized protein (DUF433 family)